MLGPTWLKVKFDLKLSNQMEKKSKQNKVVIDGETN